MSLPGPRPSVCQPSSLLGVDGRVLANYTLTTSSDAGVPGGALLLLEDGRGPDDSLAERHHRLVKGGHHYVARKEPDNADRFVAYITQPVRHHGRNYRHLSRRDSPRLIPHRDLSRLLEEQEDLLSAIGVGSEPVARLDLEVDNCRVLVSGSQKEGEVDPNLHRRVVLVPGLHQLKLTDLGTNHVFSFRFDQRDRLGQLLSSHYFPAGDGLVLLQTLTVLLSLPLSPAGQLPSLTMTANNELVKG